MRKLFRIALLVLVLAALAVCFWSLRPEAEPTPPLPDPPPVTDPAPAEPAPEEPAEPDDDPSLSGEPVTEDPAPAPDGETVDGLPVGKLVVTPERRDYEDGSLTVYIPKLEMSRTVYDGTDAQQLRLGVGLYDYAQTPGEGNRNVSLAGHRNGRSNGVVNDHAPFYYIDTLAEGDYIYLYDSEYVYRYVYDSTWIVESDDWDPIRTTGTSVVTLTSCHPIGISDHRIIVRGTLDDVVPYESDYAFAASEEGTT